MNVDCPNPADLSQVADVVFAATGAQHEIVQRLPRTRFRTATPNSGHLIAAALLIERSLVGVVTLNFDLAMSAALSELGSEDSVAVIAGPNDIAQLGNANLVYLHRNADAPADEWVLRSDHLNAVWVGGWQPVIATRILVAPNVVFVGLSSPAAVLTETIRLIRQALPVATVRVYQVDLAPFGTLPFTAALQVAETEYVQEGWCDFMDEIAKRVLEEHWFMLQQAGLTIVAENGYAPHNLEPVAQACRSLGLVGFGSARARWLLHNGPYARLEMVHPRVVADLLLAIGFVAAGLGGTVSIREDGGVEVRDGSRVLTTLGFATGGGTRTLIAVEAAIATHRRYWPWKSEQPRRVLVTGYLPSAIAPTAPLSIVSEGDENDIIDSEAAPSVVSAYDVRASPELLAGLVG